MLPGDAEASGHLFLQVVMALLALIIIGISTLIAFVVGYAAVSWFLRFLVRHSMYWFVGYRIVLGTVVLVLLSTGVVAAQ